MKLKWNTCVKVAVTVFVLYLCIHYWPTVGNLISMLFAAASPLLIGCVIAYLVNILMNAYERHYFPNTSKGGLIKSRRPICMIAAFITLAAIIVLVVWLVVPELISCISVIITAVYEAISDLVAFLAKWEVLPETIMDTLQGIDWKSRAGQIINTVLSGVGSVMDVVISTVSSVFSGVVTGLMSLIFAIYLLLGKDMLARQFNRLTKRYLKSAWRNKLYYVLAVLHESFRKYIIGQCTEAVILGGLCVLGMWILRLPYATMIGALIAVTALIPVAGAYIGGVVGALMIFSVSPVKAVVFVVFLVILQQLEGNLIYPKVVGSSLGLPAIWVLAAVTVGGGVMGIAGMLLGVPLAATLYRLLRDNLNKTHCSGDETGKMDPGLTEPEIKQNI